MRALPGIPDPPLWAYGLAIALAIAVMVRGSEPFATIETWLLTLLFATLIWGGNEGPY
jgi:hypothetical protein